MSASEKTEQNDKIKYIIVALIGVVAVIYALSVGVFGPIQASKTKMKSEIEDLSGKQKVAILIISLGQATSVQLLKLMSEIAQRPAPVRTRRQIDPVSRLRKTLGEHYQQRRLHYGIDAPNPYDPHLQRLFSSEPRHAHREAASVFLRRVRSEVVETVSQWTGQSPYTVEQIVKEMMARCRKLRPRLRPGRSRAREGLITLLTVETVYELQRGRMRLTL